MKIVEIMRLEDSFEHGTLGVMKIDKEVFCFTLEPTDRLNAPNISCIPANQYVCKPFASRKFGNTYQVQSVPGRSAILFHPGNTDNDTQGCILVGDRIGKLRSDMRGVLNSGDTFKEFMKIMEGEPLFSLTIRKVY